VGDTSRRNVANLLTTSSDKKNDALKYGKEQKAQTSREEKMDVTALMDLLDKNKSNRSVDDQNSDSAAIPLKREGRSKKGFAQVQNCLSDSDVHTPDNVNDPLFAPNPLQHITVSSIILLTALTFLGLVWMVDNKADDWFIDVSHKINLPSHELGRITPASGSSAMGQRIAHDKILAEKSQAQMSTSTSTPLIISVDSNELLQLLSKKSAGTNLKE